jgi:hypothetical protein
VLGFGLLTKAFFLPISAGVGVVLVARYAASRRILDLGQAAASGLLALAIGGGWYLSKHAETGSMIGADEFIKLKAMHGGSGFSVPQFIRGLAAIPGTFLWAGTWSLARLPEVILLVPLTTLVAVCIGYGRAMPRLSPGLRRDDIVAWAPVALAAPLAAGLLYHVYAWVAGAAAVTPGWYFHILAAPLGFAVALGWTRPRLLAATTGATVLVTSASWACQVSMYGGCAAKLGADKHYSMSGATCAVNINALAGVGNPLVGAMCLVAGLTSACAAVWIILSRDKSATDAADDGLAPLVP